MNNTRIMLHCLFSAAWADRKLDERERVWLEDCVSELHISEALRNDITAWYQRAPAEPEWRGTVLTWEDAETLMRRVLEIVTIDTTFCLREYRFVHRIRNVLGMTRNEVYRIQGEVEDILRRRLARAQSMA
jgi:hypothetical protein